MEHFSLRRFGVKRQVIPGFVQAIAIGLILAFTLPAWPADARPVKSRVPPVYPEIAKRMKISGAVRLEAVVNAQGKVTDVKEISGNHMLAIAAEEAVRQWKFAAGDGQTNESVEVMFSLDQ